MKQLPTIVQIQPHAAYASLTHGLTGRWSYLAQTVSDISNLLQPLEDAIRHHLIPAITGRARITDMESVLSALPTRLGGMGIPNPTKSCNEKFMSPEQISAPLTVLSFQQEKDNPSSVVSVASEQTSIKSKIRAQRWRAQANEAARLHEAPPPPPPQQVQCTLATSLHYHLTNSSKPIPQKQHL